MYRVGEVAKMFEINDQTVRVWCKQFAEFLTAAANPPKGATREFAEEDLKVFRYVQFALQRGHTFDEVWSQLSEGNAIKSFEEVFKSGSDLSENTSGTAITNANDLVEQYAVTVGRLGEVVEERDYLRNALEVERDAHGHTRERAARAEALIKDLPPPVAVQESRSMLWWRWLLVVGVLAIATLLVIAIVLIVQRF